MSYKGKVYVLTYEVNDYDQYGEYYLHAWAYKPSKEELRESSRFITEQDADNILENGDRGRIYSENMWFFLREVDSKVRSTNE